MEGEYERKKKYEANASVLLSEDDGWDCVLKKLFRSGQIPGLVRLLSENIGFSEKWKDVRSVELSFDH